MVSNLVHLQPLLVNGYGEDCKMDITLLACQHFCTLDVENVVLFPKRQHRSAQVSISHEYNAKVSKNAGVIFCRRQEEMRYKFSLLGAHQSCLSGD